MNNEEESVDALNRLIEILKDGNHGYKHAAEKIENVEFKTVLYRLSQQRALFEAELRDELRHLGAEQEGEAGVIGSLHKTWMDLKSGLSGKDTVSILEQCQNGEKAAIEAYEDVLKKELPHYIKERINNQFHLIKGAYNQLEEFQQHPEG